MMQRFIACERVSTARQGARGLGLEAQRNSIDGFAYASGAEVLARFTEAKSGCNLNRPELTKAIQLARLTDATLVITKLDRPSRNVAILLTLRSFSASTCQTPMTSTWASWPSWPKPNVRQELAGKNGREQCS